MPGTDATRYGAWLDGTLAGVCTAYVEERFPLQTCSGEQGFQRFCCRFDAMVIKRFKKARPIGTELETLAASDLISVLPVDGYQSRLPDGGVEPACRARLTIVSQCWKRIRDGRKAAISGSNFAGAPLMRIR